VERFGGSLPGLRLLVNPGNRGKGYSIRHGFRESRGRRVLLTDADLSTPIEEVGKLLPALERDGFGGAIGSRAVDRSTVELPQGWLRQTMGKSFNLLVRLLTGLSFRDTQCGFKLLDRKAFAPVFHMARVDRFSYDVEILMLASRQGIRVSEIPVLWRNSPQSKVSLLRDSTQMLWDIIRITLRARTGGYRDKSRGSLGEKSSPEPPWRQGRRGWRPGGNAWASPMPDSIGCTLVTFGCWLGLGGWGVP